MSKDAPTTKNHKYVVALPCFPGERGFNHQTILVSAVDKKAAISLVRYLKPQRYIGDIKEVFY